MRGTRPSFSLAYINASAAAEEKMQEAKALDLLVMLGILAGHAGDVENDADDVDEQA